jgi:hypothetical protein
MTKAETFAQQDEVVLLVLDAMGYIDDTRQASFVDCTASMTNPGPRLSSVPASIRNTSKRSFSLTFINPHMVDIEMTPVSVRNCRSDLLTYGKVQSVRDGNAYHTRRAAQKCNH